MGTVFRVIKLEVLDHPNAVVRAGELVDIVARTQDVEVDGPDNLQIEWSGDLGLNPKINGGTLETSFAPGEHTVTATGAAGGNSVTVRAWQSEASVAQGGEFAITDEPQMPVITAQLKITGPVTHTTDDWTCDVEFEGADDCRNIPNFGVINSDEFVQAGGDQFRPRFDKVRGRSVAFTVNFTVEGQHNKEFAFATIKGTNPQRSDVQGEFGYRDDELKEFAKRYKSVLSRIACRESGQRQFDAEADGGVSGCPLYSSNRRGRVGIMQIPDPTADQIWNWKENVTAGIRKFQKSVAAAEGYPNEVMESDGFKKLVGRFNERRQQQGLKIVNDVVLLPFEVGDFNDEDDPILRQHELDAIRGYDDSADDDSRDEDRFGLKLHEYRVVVDLIDGEEVLRVTNITATDEGTLRGEAVWEQVPVADRHTGRPNYVEEVLSFLFDCTPAVMPCNLTGISPTTVTVFAGQTRTFTAEGTGLAKVQWKAPGGTPRTGTGAKFTTKWREKGQKTITAKCGGTTKTATAIVLNLETEIADVVQVSSVHPHHIFIVPCKIRFVGPATAPVRLDLLDSNERVQFSFPADTTTQKFITVELPASEVWVPFEISGDKASEKKGDAEIKALHGPDDMLVKKVTVFTFDKAKISVKKGGTYVLVSGVYGPDNGVAVSFSAKARLRPAGLDCTAPQIASLRIGIMQDFDPPLVLRTTTWDRPTVKFDPDPSVPPVPSGTEVTVKNSILEEIALGSGPATMGVSRVLSAAPLWDNTPAALKPPTGCTGAGAATSFAAPLHEDISPTHSEVLPSDDNHFPKAAKVTWTRLVNTTLSAFFRTYCVVFNTDGTKRFSALRQTVWTLDVDSSGPRAKQRAVVEDDEDATFDPAPPPQTDPTFITRYRQVGDDTILFRK